MGRSERSRRREAKAKRYRQREAGPWRSSGELPIWISVAGDFALHGLEFGVAQVFGAIEIVPILRKDIRSDFRVLRRMYEGHPFSARTVDADDEPRWLCVPSGIVIDDDDDGRGQANFGARVLEARRNNLPQARTLARLTRLRARKRSQHPSFLPDHVVRWGFMQYLYGFPGNWEESGGEMIERAHLEWAEGMVSGGRVPGLAEALRVFEIVDGQVGSMVWIAGQLNGILLVPHPDDYRALHYSLLGDLYAESVCQYARSWAAAPSHYRGDIEQLLDRASPTSVAELREVFARLRAHVQINLDERIRLAHELALVRDGGRAHGPFMHYRLRTDLVRRGANYVGEMIARDHRIEYLELLQLNHAQSRRAYLMSLMQNHHWDLEAVAKHEQCTVDALRVRLANIGIHVHSWEGRRIRFWYPVCD